MNKIRLDGDRKKGSRDAQKSESSSSKEKHQYKRGKKELLDRYEDEHRFVNFLVK